MFELLFIPVYFVMFLTILSVPLLILKAAFFLGQSLTNQIKTVVSIESLKSFTYRTTSLNSEKVDFHIKQLFKVNSVYVSPVFPNGKLCGVLLLNRHTVREKLLLLRKRTQAT